MVPATTTLSPLDDLIYKTDIYSLLSLENLSEDDKNTFTLNLTRAVITKGLEKYISSHNLDEATLSEIERKLKEFNDPIAAQNYLMEVFPDLMNDIVAVTVDLKKQALLKQIVDLHAAFENSAQTAEGWENVTDNLVRALKSNDYELFEQNYSTYKSLKGKANQ